MSNQIKFFGSFTKMAKQDDGCVIVEGICSSEAVDHDGELIKADAMRAALPDFMKFGNIREMHQPLAAGIAMKCDVQDDGKTYLQARIVDPVAVKKCETGVYKGFSIGGGVLERDEINKTVITKIRLSEISLVDRPANPDAVFTLGKVSDVEKADSHHNKIGEFATAAAAATKAAHAASKTAKSGQTGHHAAAAAAHTHAAHKHETAAANHTGTHASSHKAAAATHHSAAKHHSAKAMGKDASPDDLAKFEQDCTEIAKIAERDDTSAKEGENKYGDVRFADEKNKKYPIDTAAHIRAAWNYINKPHNAGKYSSEDADTIKSHIVAAWKEKIDSAGPPSAAEKCLAGFRAEMLSKSAKAAPMLKALAELRGDTLEKGMYAVAQLAMIVDSLNCLQEGQEWEAAFEGDGSVLPDELKQAVKDLGEILIHMADEEIEELTMEDEDADVVAFAAKVDDLHKFATGSLKKVGAKHSKETMDKLQTIHDTVHEMGAKCVDAGDENKAEAEDAEKLHKADLKKAHSAVTEITDALKKAHGERDELKKQLSTVTVERDTALVKAKQWDALPAKPKGPAISINKAEDNGTGEPVKKVEPVMKDGKVDGQATAKALIADSLRSAFHN